MLRRVKSKIAFIIVSVASIFSAHLVAAEPASAAWSDCPPGWMCLFTGTNGTGDLFYTAAQPATLGWMNTNAKSAWNRTGIRYCAFQYTNHGNFQYYFNTGTKYGGLAAPTGPSSLGKVGGGYC